MKARTLFTIFAFAGSCVLFSLCNERSSSAKKISGDSISVDKNYGGFPSEVLYGKHLVTIAGCNDCHTPKKMTPRGPVLDTSLLLSGHVSAMPTPDVNRKEMESKGLATTNDMTAWVGPWGVSYSANLTPDATGIGNWSEAQFIRAIRAGKWKGLENSRPLLPPMPWQELGEMTDSEMKAIYAYLKSIKPVNNTVSPPLPPVSAPHHG